MFISNLILKAFDSLWKSKKFSSWSFQAFKSYIFAIQGTKKAIYLLYKEQKKPSYA